MDTIEEESDELREHRELYFGHLDNIAKSKCITIDSHKHNFNTLVECMALGTIPVFKCDPNLHELTHKSNYLLENDTDYDQEAIISNNKHYYENNVSTKVILNKIMDYLFTNHT